MTTYGIPAESIVDVTTSQKLPEVTGKNFDKILLIADSVTKTANPVDIFNSNSALDYLPSTSNAVEMIDNYFRVSGSSPLKLMTFDLLSGSAAQIIFKSPKWDEYINVTDKASLAVVVNEKREIVDVKDLNLIAGTKHTIKYDLTKTFANFFGVSGGAIAVYLDDTEYNFDIGENPLDFTTASQTGVLKDDLVLIATVFRNAFTGKGITGVTIKSDDTHLIFEIDKVGLSDLRMNAVIDYKGENLYQSIYLGTPIVSNGTPALDGDETKTYVIGQMNKALTTGGVKALLSLVGDTVHLTGTEKGSTEKLAVENLPLAGSKTKVIFDIINNINNFKTVSDGEIKVTVGTTEIETTIDFSGGTYTGVASADVIEIVRIWNAQLTTDTVTDYVVKALGANIVIENANVGEIKLTAGTVDTPAGTDLTGNTLLDVTKGVTSLGTPPTIDLFGSKYLNGHDTNNVVVDGTDSVDRDGVKDLFLDLFKTHGKEFYYIVLDKALPNMILHALVDALNLAPKNDLYAVLHESDSVDAKIYLNGIPADLDVAEQMPAVGGYSLTFSDKLGYHSGLCMQGSKSVNTYTQPNENNKYEDITVEGMITSKIETDDTKVLEKYNIGYYSEVTDESKNAFRGGKTTDGYKMLNRMLLKRMKEAVRIEALDQKLAGNIDPDDKSVKKFRSNLVAVVRPFARAGLFKREVTKDYTLEKGYDVFVPPFDELEKDSDGNFKLAPIKLLVSFNTGENKGIQIEIVEV